jgi:hypothetical protein
MGSGCVGRPGTVILATALIVLSGLVLLLLIQMWPSPIGSGNRVTTNHIVLGVKADLNIDQNLILIAVLSGALGGLLHSLRSISWYVGQRALRWSWVLFYACLPFVGAILAVLFYFALRGGLISGSGASSSINPYGIAATGSLVGLFSIEAAEMLKKAFSTVFTKAPEGNDSKTVSKSQSDPPKIN